MRFLLLAFLLINPFSFKDVFSYRNQNDEYSSFVSANSADNSGSWLRINFANNSHSPNYHPRPQRWSNLINPYQNYEILEQSVISINGRCHSFFLESKQTPFGKAQRIIVDSYPMVARQIKLMEKASGQICSELTKLKLDELALLQNHAQGLLNQINGDQGLSDQLSEIGNMGTYKMIKHKYHGFNPVKRLKKSPRTPAIKKFLCDITATANALLKDEVHLEKCIKEEITEEQRQRKQGNLNSRTKVRQDFPSRSKQITEERFFVSSEAQKYIDAFAPSLPDLRKSVGNLIQHNIHSEIVCHINDASNVLAAAPHDAYLDNCMQILLGAAGIGLELKELKKYDQAYSFSDFCGTIVGVIKGTVKGVFLGMSNFSDGVQCLLDRFLDDPFDLAKDIGLGFLEQIKEIRETLGVNLNPGLEGQFNQKTLHRECQKRFRTIKSFPTDLKNNPDDKIVKFFAEATEFVLHLALWEVGFTKASQFIQPLVDTASYEGCRLLEHIKNGGTKTEGATVATPVTNILVEAGDVAEHAMSKTASGGSRSKLVKEACETVRRNPNIKSGNGRLSDVVKRISRVEEGLQSQETLQELRKLIKKSKPSNPNTASFQREVIFDDGYKLIFRNDTGPRAHTIRKKYGPTKRINHFNVELQVESQNVIVKSGTEARWEKTAVIHIVVDEFGNVLEKAF